jgi:hypothetical protein
MQIGTADSEDLQPIFEPDGPSSGFRSTHFVYLGDIDDGGTVNAPKLFRVQFFGQGFDRFVDQAFVLPGEDRLVLCRQGLPTGWPF